MCYLGAGELTWDGREVFDRTFALGDGSGDFIIVPIQDDVLNAWEVLLIHYYSIPVILMACASSDFLR